jgi:hypothetical protein
MRRRKYNSSIGDLNQLLRTLLWIVLIVVLVVFYYKSRGNDVTVEVDQKIDVTPNQITALRDIGQWEFLSVSDEEMVDTTRRGLISNDQLIRIYYGTLRLGIDTRKARQDWITTQGDSVFVVLPPVELLDKNFIDEARTQSFFESGKWSDADRARLYKRAYANMRRRCLTRENVTSAEDNALRQFTQMMRNMGFTHVEVKVEQGKGK